MRLRLGLLNEDVADIFGISPRLSSRISTTWIKVLSKLLGEALITWLPQEAVHSNLPGVFIKAGYKKCCVILDCAEVSIDRAKSLYNIFIILLWQWELVTDILLYCKGQWILQFTGTKRYGCISDTGFQIHEELLLRF